MKKMLSEEFDRAIHDPRIWIVLLVTVIFFGYQYRHTQTSVWIPQGYSFADLWYFIYSKSYYIYFIPLAAALPFADSMVVDRTQDFLRYLVVRSSYRHYLSAKFLINAVTGFCTIAVPLFILYIFTNIIAPRSLYVPNTWQPRIAGRPEDMWLPLFQSNPDLFILFVIFLAGWVGAVYATLGLSASLLYRNRYLALGTPFVIFVLTDFIVQRTRIFGPSFSPLAAVVGVSPIQNMSLSLAGIVLNPLLVLFLSGILLVLFGKRERILQ